jgi:hypothetical protein
MNSVTMAGTVPAYIESGRVLDVDLDTYTVSVATQFSKKPQLGIPFSTPYQHFSNGEGIYFMPEVGSLCWICFPSDGQRPFVIGWAPASNEGDYRAKKRDLNPGDIYLGTRDENFLMLRRGGVVEIGGGPLCQRIFLPINNTIKDFCENYGLHTLGGDLEWTVSREENTTDGKRPASLKVLAREFANDPNPIAELEIGSHEGDSSSILSLIIKESGQDGADTKLSLTIKKDGEVVWNIQNDLKLVTKNDLNLTSTDAGVKITAKTLADITADVFQATAKGTGGVLLQTTNGFITLKASKGVKILGPGFFSLQVDGATYPVVLATPSFVSWIMSHTHIITSPGTQSSPPFPVMFGYNYSATGIWSS